MNYADKVFIDNCRYILEYDHDQTGEDVRPRWEDRTPAYTKKAFALVNRYDLSKEFPVITLRKQNFKAALDELLWIWQKKSNRIDKLNSHI